MISLKNLNAAKTCWKYDLFEVSFQSNHYIQVTNNTAQKTS